MHPQTDIVCLVHNQYEITKVFIEHLFKNTSNFHLIFVDNGSTCEKTKNCLSDGAKDKKWELITLEKNYGVISGRNIAATHVESNYFVNIDNDQYPQKDWLLNLHNLMEKGYDVVGVEAWLLSPPNSKNTIIFHGEKVNQDYFPIKRCTHISEPFTYIGCGGMLLKKEVYQKIGLFDEDYNPAFFEDPDFSFKCIQNGYKLGWCPDAKIIHLAHQTFNNQKTFDKNAQFLKSWKVFKNKWNPYYPQPIRMNFYDY